MTVDEALKYIISMGTVAPLPHAGDIAHAAGHASLPLASPDARPNLQGPADPAGRSNRPG
jgi:hypothetical protein